MNRSLYTLLNLNAQLNTVTTDRLHEMIRDRLVCGIANERWQQRLLAEADLTYAKAYKLLQSLEASEKEVKDLSRKQDTSTVNYQQHTKSFTPRRWPPPTGTQTTAKSCYRCGGKHNSDICRFKEAECRYCHKKGHIASVCRQKRKGSTNTVDQSDGNVPDEYALPVDWVINSVSKPLTITMDIAGTPVQMEVDTGAYLATWRNHTAPAIKPTTTRLKTYTGEEISVEGLGLG